MSYYMHTHRHTHVWVHTREREGKGGGERKKYTLLSFLKCQTLLVTIQSYLLKKQIASVIQVFFFTFYSFFNIFKFHVICFDYTYFSSSSQIHPSPIHSTLSLSLCLCFCLCVSLPLSLPVSLSLSPLLCVHVHLWWYGYELDLYMHTRSHIGCLPLLLSNLTYCNRVSQ